jgi:hypothetical protein
VTTAFHAAPGTLCSAFPSLGLAQTAAGQLGASGCALPDGTPYEAYWLHTFGAGTLTVNVASGDFGPAIFVRTEDGAPIAIGDSSVTTSVDADTRYEVVIATADRTGAFQLTTTFQPDDDETCRAVRTLSGTDSQAGALTPDSCAAVTATGDLAFFDFYTLTASDAGLADIQVQSGDFLPRILVLDDSGNRIAAVDGAELRLQLAPGTYTLEIVSSIASGGVYLLNYQFTTGPPQACAQVPASPGDGPSGAFSSSSCRAEVGLADLYSMTLPATGTLDLTLTSSDPLTGMLAIRDRKDNLIVMNQDAQGLGTTRLSADLPPGAYTVVAAALSGAGGYQLATAFTAHPLPPCAFGQQLDSNGGYVQKLGINSCRGPNGEPVDYYEFTLPADSTVAMIMTSSEVDGFLTLLDSAGNVLRSDDNSYGFGDPLMIDRLSAGTYRLAARAASGSTGGLYEVDVRSLPNPRAEPCSALATVPAGGSVTGSISFGGCQYTDATFADIYKVEVGASATVDFRLNSGDFDAYLLLLDAKGNLVDQDDNSGGGTNARLNLLLAPGAYYVVAKPVSDYRSGGAYTLSVQ